MKKNEEKNIIIFASNIFFHSKFNITLIDTLLENFNVIHLAYDFDLNKSFFEEDFIFFCKNNNITLNNISVPRSLFKLHKIFLSLIQTIKLFKKIKPDIVHTHTPIISMVVRISSIFLKHEVIYTAHGLHFYHRNNYLVGRHFYFIERLLSKITDKICLINYDDFLICKNHFFCDVFYVPGIGFDTNAVVFNRNFRAQENSVLKFLSVGELNKNKNHILVIKALSAMNIDFIYTICGEGSLKDELYKNVNLRELQSQVKFAGYVDNVNPFLESADVFIHPSIREGLPVALMEAMSYQLPILASDIRGCGDLIEESKGGFLFDPLDVDSFKEALIKLLNSKHKWLQMGLFNQNKLKDFSKSVVKEKYLNIYNSKEY